MEEQMLEMPRSRGCGACWLCDYISQAYRPKHMTIPLWSTHSQHMGLWHQWPCGQHYVSSYECPFWKGWAPSSVFVFSHHLLKQWQNDSE